MSYLQSHTIASVIRGSFGIYFSKLPALLIIYAIPLVPFYILRASITAPDQGWKISLPMQLVEFMLTTFVSFPTTIAVSEICLGIKPSVWRAYSRVFTNAGRVFGTYLLSMLIILLGFLALFVPGVVFAIWYIFVAQVVLIESIDGRHALKRSRELGRGFYWRNFGIVFVVIVFTYVLATIAAFLAGLPLGLNVLVSFVEMDQIKGQTFIIVSYVLFAPVTLISIVLLYYDMRARKEGYGAAQLAEDLQF